MTAIYPTSPAKALTDQEIIQFCQQELGGKLDRQRVLVLVPDQTRTLPLPHLFAAGPFAVGVGSALLQKDWILKGRYQRIMEAANRFHQQLQLIR